MASESSSFFRYPRTVHITGSEVVDDDESVSPAELLAFAGKNYKLILQEKVDGANVSVHFEQEWEPIIQKRSGLIGTGEKTQYDVFRTWVYERLDDLFSLLGTDLVMYGEWMWTQHAIVYDALPSFFIAFDLYSKSTKAFLSSAQVTERLRGKVETVPVLHSAAWPLSKGQTLDGLIKKLLTTSRFGTQTAEGIYIRIEDEEKVIYRSKYRRRSFTSGRTDFGKVDRRNTLKKP